MIVIKKIKLYQDPELDEEGRPITKPLTEEENIKREELHLYRYFDLITVEKI